MTKKHFEHAAQIVHDEMCTPEERRLMCLAFVELFRAHNPRFNAERFAEACGVTL